MNLECSSKGNKLYSAFYARVSVNNVMDSIENHYQLAKRFGDSPPPKTWRDSKGRKPTHFVVGTKEFPVEYLSAYYKVLWIKYLDANPNLVAYAQRYDTFSDMFRGNSINCQADCVRDYVKKGRDYLMLQCQEFLSLYK